MPFTFSIMPPAAGWLDATLTADETLSLRASYLSDGVDDLARVVIALLEGASEARCAWADEPGEHRWLFMREGEQVHIRVLRLERTFSRLGDEQGEGIFSATTPLLRLATQTLGSLRQLHNDPGPDAYESAWRHPFPLQQMERLASAVAGKKGEALR